MGINGMGGRNFNEFIKRATLYRLAAPAAYVSARK